MIAEKEGPHFQAAWNFLSILALGLVVFLSLEPRLLYPLGDNEGFYSYYASQMAKGLRLYRDLWDHKPPGLFLQYFLLGRVLPLDEAHLRLYVCLVHILNAVLLMGLGRRLGFTRPAAWGAAFCYALFLYPALLQPWSAEADLLGLPFLLAALLLAHSTREAALFFSGALFAMAFLTKQSAALVFPVFLSVRNLRSPRNAGLWAGGALLTLFAVLLPILLDGRFPDFWDAFARFNHFYVSSSWDFFLRSPAYQSFELQWLLYFGLVYGLPVLGFFLFMAFKPEAVEPGSPRLFLGLWFLGALGSCFLSAYFFSYYFLALLPPVCLALAYGLQRGVKGKFWRSGIFCGWALGAALASGLNLGGVGDRIFSVCQYATARYETDRDLGLLLRQNAAPGDRLFCWACEPSLFAYAGLPMAVVRSPVINHLRYLTLDAESAPDRFDREAPQFCVLSHSSQVPPVPGWLLQDLDQDYTRVNFTSETPTGDLELYVSNKNKVKEDQ
jgi:hypothetical protein